jgi:osmotically-inducible protein OsmY
LTSITNFIDRGAGDGVAGPQRRSAKSHTTALLLIPTISPTISDGISISGGDRVSKFRLAGHVAAALGLCGSLCGCPLAIVGGLAGAGGAGYAANQERGVGGAASDVGTSSTVKSALFHADPQLGSIGVTVYEGRTLLTGTAATPQLKAEAADIARRTPGVRVVYDEIEVAPPETVWRSTQDAWISSEVKTKLVFSDVRSVNYNIDTVDGSVYLIGSARSQTELDHATYAARTVPGVKRVVSYIEVRPGIPPSTGPAVASAPAVPPASGAAVAPEPPPVTAAPTTPVEVQHL